MRLLWLLVTPELNRFFVSASESAQQKRSDPGIGHEASHQSIRIFEFKNDAPPKV